MAARGQYPKGVAKREEILEVALDLFARKGYDRTSVREIARMTGLSQTGLLHHFSSKEELFTEVLRRRDARNEQAYEERSGGKVTADAFASIVGHNAREPGLVRLFVTLAAESTDRDNPAHGFFEERYRRLRDSLASDVRDLQVSGEIAADLDADSVAALLVAAADGLQIQWLLSPGSTDMGGHLDALWSIVRRVR
ncbi:TetR/AcrR family transcriptional regulator [Promicromonospora sukumoe]|uniref:TetR/AcrR family transcriptional regulator n=1 Tax=Promicromonospora sukumoe TaxID=88382 RepID=UPI0036471536